MRRQQGMIYSPGLSPRKSTPSSRNPRKHLSNSTGSISSTAKTFHHLAQQDEKESIYPIRDKILTVARNLMALKSYDTAEGIIKYLLSEVSEQETQFNGKQLLAEISSLKEEEASTSILDHNADASTILATSLSGSDDDHKQAPYFSVFESEEQEEEVTRTTENTRRFPR